MDSVTASNILQGFWPVIVSIVGLIWTWARFTQKLTDLTERIASIEEVQKNTNDTNNKIQVQLSQIQADLVWIKERLNHK